MPHPRLPVFLVSAIACSAVLAGCAKPEDRADETSSVTDTAAAGVATPGASAPISLAEAAGKWKVRSTDEAGGNVVEVEMVVTPDRSDWTLTAPNRKPIPVRVIAIAGDSIVTEAGPYASFVRKGLMVRTRTINRLQDGKLVGTIEARYAMGGRDSVAYRRMEGTRAP